MVQPGQVTSTQTDRAPLPGLARPKMDGNDVAAVSSLLNPADPRSVERAVASMREVAGRNNLDQRQILTFQQIAGDTRRYGSAENAMAAARLYLQLLGAGCYAYNPEFEPNARLSQRDAQDGRDLIAELVKGASFVWRGTDVRRQGFEGFSPAQRLNVFVEQFFLATNRNQAFDQALQTARAHMLTQRGQQVYAQSAGLGNAWTSDLRSLTFPTRPALVRSQQQPQTPPSTATVRHQGPSPRHFTQRPPVAARPLGPRPASENPYPTGNQPAAAADRNRPPETIRGTQTPWSPDAVVNHLMQNTGDEARMDVLHGMRLQDRIAVAEAWSQRRGNGATGPAALEAFIRDMGGNGNSLNARIFRDMLRPENANGVTSEHILIYADATGGNFLSKILGIGGPNSQAIERILMFRSPEELRRIDQQCQETFGKSLRDVLGMVNVREGRERLLFIHDLPNRDNGMGEVPQSELQAWNMRTALDEFDRGILGGALNGIEAFSNVEWHNVFRPLAMMSESELRATAQAYHRQQVAAGRQPDGSDGRTGNIADSALGRAILAAQRRVTRLSPAQADHERRTILALQGLRFDRQAHVPPRQAGEADAAYAARVDAAINQAELRHRSVVAQYVAATIRVAGRQHLSTEDTQFALSLMRPFRAGQPFEANGRPFVGEVAQYFDIMGGQQPQNLQTMAPEQREAYEQQRAEQMVRSSNNSVKGTYNQNNTYNLFTGDGTDSPMSRAVQLMSALQGSMGMFSGPYRQRTYALLDLRGIPEEQRDDFMAQMRAEYYRISGGRQLQNDLAQGFGPSITLPGASGAGASIPSQAMRLAQRGVLSNAERVIYALYEPGLFGIVRADNIQAVNGILSELSPLEKVIVRSEFQRLTGRDLREVIDASPGREARAASLALRVFPHERDLLGAQAMLYLNAPTMDPAMAQQRAQLLGVSQAVLQDFWSRNFYDQAGLDAMRTVVDQSGGAAQFSLRSLDSSADINASLRATSDAYIGNPLTRTIQDALSNEREGIGIRRRQIEELTERAQREIAATGSIAPQTQAEMGFIIRDLRLRYISRGQNVDKATELVSNIMVTGALVGAMAFNPSIGAMWMSVIGGGTGLATRMALGQVDTVSQGVGIFIRDAAKGLATQQTAAMMSYVPADAPLALHGVMGMSAGYNHGAITSVANFVTDPQLWRYDPAQALADFNTNFTNATNSGMFWGGVSGLIFGAIRRNAHKDGEQPGRPDDPDRPVDPDRPTRPGDPPDRPVTPGDPPTRPGDPPDRPVTPGNPTRPTGPGNIGTPDGPVPGRPGGTRPDPGISTPTGPTPGRPGGTRPDPGISTPTGPTPGRPGGIQPGTSNPPPTTTNPPPTTTNPPPTGTGTGVSRPGGTTPGTTPGTTAPGRDVNLPSRTDPVATAPTPTPTPTTPVVTQPRPGTVNTGVGSPVAGRSAVTRSAMIPDTSYSATLGTSDPAGALNIGIIHWGAIATAGVTNFGVTLSEQQSRDITAIGRRMETTPVPLREVHEALRTMSREENRQVMRQSAAGFVFSAFAYMQANGGQLPGNETARSDFNVLLDLAWTDAGLARGRQSSQIARSTKINELVAHYYQSPNAPIQPQQPQPGPSEPRTTPTGPRNPQPAPNAPGRADPAIYRQLAAATGRRLERVPQTWIDQNLANAITFRTGQQVQQFPEGGVEYWARLINGLPNRAINGLIRDDGAALRAFGYRADARAPAVNEALFAARDRALAMAQLGGTAAAPAPLSPPELFRHLPELAGFMQAATGKTPDQMARLSPEQLAQAVVIYKQRLAQQVPQVMQGATQGPIIDQATLEAHRQVTGASGPNPLPQDTGGLRQAFEGALNGLKAAPVEQVAAASANAVRALEATFQRNMPDSDRRRDVAAIADAVLNGPGDRVQRVGQFLVGTQGSPQIAAEVWNVINGQLTPEQKQQLALEIAAGRVQIDIQTIGINVLQSLDRLPGGSAEYQQAARALRDITVQRLVQIGDAATVVTEELPQLLIDGNPQTLALAAQLAPNVPAGRAMLLSAFIRLANEGKADRVGVVIQAIYRVNPPYAADLATTLFSPAVFNSQVNRARRDALAINVAFRQPLAPNARQQGVEELVSAMATTEQGRVALETMKEELRWETTTRSLHLGVGRVLTSNYAELFDAIDRVLKGRAAQR